MSDTEARILRVASRLGDERLDSLDSPTVPEVLGTALAARLREYRPAAIALWSSPDAAVLGHVVARELGALVVPALQDQGRLIVGSRLRPGTRVAVVDVAWEDLPGPAPLIRTLVGHGYEVVAVGTVLSGPQDALAADLPVHTLEAEPEAGT